jgi:hypothetical protein
MERTLWTDARLDDAFRELREDMRECLDEGRKLRRDWQRGRDEDVQRRELERKEHKKDRFALVMAIVGTFGVLTPVILVLVSSHP